jgi:hypothetical protein
MLGTKILPVILVAVPATLWLAAQPSFGESAGDMCRSSPGASAPPGMHWYYHIDRTTKQHCWYLNAEGMHVRSFGNVASPAPSQHENAGEQAGTTPSDAVQTKTEQPAAIQSSSTEASLLEPAARERAAVGFAARWLELPKSLDLDARAAPPPSNGYAGESDASEHQGTDVETQMPSPSFMVRDRGAESRQRSELSFGSILLACALGTVLLLLCREAFRLAGMLHLEVKRRRARAAFVVPGDSEPVVGGWRDNAVWRTPRPAGSDSRDEASLSELRHVLQRADAASYSPRSFAPAGYRVTKIPTVRRILRRKYFGRRTHSALNASNRNYAAV